MPAGWGAPLGRGRGTLSNMQGISSEGPPSLLGGHHVDGISDDAGVQVSGWLEKPAAEVRMVGGIRSGVVVGAWMAVAACSRTAPDDGPAVVATAEVPTAAVAVAVEPAVTPAAATPPPAAVATPVPSGTPATPPPPTPSGAVPPPIPTPIPSVEAEARWCFVAPSTTWEVACTEERDEVVWGRIWCHWEADWKTIPWNVMPGEIKRPVLDTETFEPVPTSQIAELGTCDLGVTPPEALRHVTPLPYRKAPGWGPPRRRPPAGKAATNDARPADAAAPEQPLVPADGTTSIAAEAAGTANVAVAANADPGTTTPQATATGEAATAGTAASEPRAEGASGVAPPTDDPAPDNDDNTDTSAQDIDAPATKASGARVVARVPPAVIREDRSPPGAVAKAFGDLVAWYRKSEDGPVYGSYALTIPFTWRADVNGDGIDDWFAVHEGRRLFPPRPKGKYFPDEFEDLSPEMTMVEGFAWVDGRRPKTAANHAINELGEDERGLAACGLMVDPATQLTALVLHDFNKDPCSVAMQEFALVPLDPNADSDERLPPRRLEPGPVLRVRDPSAGIFNRNHAGLETFLGFRHGMTVAEVSAVLSAAQAPPIAAEALMPAADGTVALASGPTLRFDSQGRLIGVRVAAGIIAEAIRGRGLDDALLDILGESSAAVARVLAGRRGDSLVFDGTVNRTLGVVVTVDSEKGRVGALEVVWYTRRPHLKPVGTFMGVTLGRKLTTLPAALAKAATARADGWDLGDDGVKLTTAASETGDTVLVRVEAAATTGTRAMVAKEPLLALTQAAATALTDLVGMPDSGDGSEGNAWTWQVPTPAAPAWTLHATVKNGRLEKVWAEIAR